MILVHAREQRGSSIMEYIVALLFSVMAVWGIVGMMQNDFVDHHKDYTWSISQPYL